MGSDLVGQIILIIVLTLVNALFAASELAYVSVNHFKLEDEASKGDKAAQRVLDLLEDSDDFLSTIQIAITFAGFLNSASAATSIAGYIAPLFGNHAWAEPLSVVIVTLLISYITLVFGELFPKAVALQMPNEFAKLTSPIIKGTQFILKPFVWLTSASTNLLKKIVPIDFTEEGQKMTREEFQAYMNKSRKDEVIDYSEFSMLEGVLSLDDKIARELMVPRTEAFMIDYDDTTEENVDKLLNLQYSRVPLYQDDKDNVMGIIHVKNLLKASADKPLYDVDLKDIMNEALFVPETLYIDDLLYEMQRTNNTMAILTDEYGGTVGLVTTEDIMEEIVGEIDDEYDDTSTPEIIDHQDGTYSIEGSAALHTFNEYFNTTVSSEAVDSIAGYLIEQTGIIPSEDLSQEEIEDNAIMIDQYHLTIENVEGTRITEILVEIIESDDMNEDEALEE